MPLPSTRASARLIALFVALATAAVGAVVGALPARAVLLGTPVPAARYPFAAELVVRLDANTTEFCGGTLVAQRWVLTAAHCLVDDHGHRFAVRTLRVSVGAERPDWERAALPVTRTVVHPRYVADPSGRPGPWDVGLVELARPAASVPLALTSAEPGVGAKVRYLGWGCTDVVRAWCTGPSRRLELGSTQVQRDSACALTGAWATTALCTARYGVAATVQAGDSGGPLVVATVQGDRLAGVTSAAGPTRDIATSVVALRPWIRATTGLKL